MLEQEDKLFLAQCFRFLALARKAETEQQIEQLFDKALSKEYYDRNKEEIERLVSTNSELTRQVKEARRYTEDIRTNTGGSFKLPWEN